MSALEPLPDVDPLTASVGKTFVIQQHHATALHHDFRLEMLNEEGPVLVSWAVPKGLPRRKGERHLAIRTPDHPMDHATFAGSIPGDEYGGGEVRIFDHGEYEMVGRTGDRLTFRLDGERLAGVWHLVSTGLKDGKEQWLALMSRDLRPPAQERPPLEPMLATQTAEAFDDPEWEFEPKWDGIRALAVCEEDTRFISRRNHDITVAYPELHRIHEQVVALDAVVDGELVAFKDGVPSFQTLQQRMHLRNQKQVEQLSLRIPVVYMAFDLLYIDGRDLTGQPLLERRRMLEDVVVASEQIQISPAVVGDGVALFRAAAGQGLEGIMAKRLSSRYVPGARSRDWLKVKIKFDADVVIVGWTEGEGRRLGSFGSLMMAVYDGDELRYAGNVGTGFDADSLHEVLDRLQDLDETKPPFPAEVLRSRPELRRAHWVTPSLVAKVEHRQVTSAGRLRSPSFLGLRDDKDPRECTIDQLQG
jgi:bifunctional non-homologous end joining protein LigD